MPTIDGTTIITTDLGGEFQPPPLYETLVPMVFLPRMRSETYQDGISPQDEVRNLCISQPTQVLQTLWTLHALDPLYMLFQSALAMLNIL